MVGQNRRERHRGRELDSAVWVLCQFECFRSRLYQKIAPAFAPENAEGYCTSFSGGQLRVEGSDEKRPPAVQRPAARCRLPAKRGPCSSPSTLPPSPPEKLSRRSQS